VETQRYNGWENYETWAVKLQIDNEEGSYDYWNETTDETIENVEARWEWQTDKDAQRLHLADTLKDWYQENMPLDGADIFTDLLQAALGEVNWHEIAESMLEDAKERTAA